MAAQFLRLSSILSSPAREWEAGWLPLDFSSILPLPPSYILRFLPSLAFCSVETYELFRAQPELDSSGNSLGLASTPQSLWILLTCAAVFGVELSESPLNSVFPWSEPSTGYQCTCSPCWGILTCWLTPLSGYHEGKNFLMQIQRQRTQAKGPRNSCQSVLACPQGLFSLLSNNTLKIFPLSAGVTEGKGRDKYGKAGWLVPKAPAGRGEGAM